MKGLSPSQLEALCQELRSLVGGYLQKMMASDRDLVLGIWTKAGLRWIWIDMKLSEPYLALITDLPSQELKKKPPVLNFLKAHAEGRPLIKAEFSEEKGRVLDLRFGDGRDHLNLEIRLIPHAPNIIAQKSGKTPKGKQVSWNRVKDLGDFKKEATEFTSDQELSDSHNQWLKRFKKSSAKAMTAEEIHKRYQKELEKKKSVIEKVQGELIKKQDPVWRKLGAWLKTHQNLNVPSEWQSLISPNQSLASNIEKTFKQAKDNDTKLEGTRQRLGQLEQEYEQLQAMSPGKWFERNATKKAPNKIGGGRKLKTGFKARSLELDEEMKVYFGKSGADNLKLLRQARAWDIWLHLKDEPGSHALLFRPKNREVKAEYWQKIGAKLIEYSLGEKAKERNGDRFEMLICEVRYVTPIKGDRLGRVNYQNEKVMGFIYKS